MGMMIIQEQAVHPAAMHKTRATEVAYDTIEGMIATLQLQPGQAIVESELVERTGLNRTPIREELLRLVAGGLIEQEPRRGMRVSEIGVAEHLTRSEEHTTELQ